MTITYYYPLNLIPPREEAQKQIKVQVEDYLKQAGRDDDARAIIDKMVVKAGREDYIHVMVTQALVKPVFVRVYGWRYY